jgi:hypothetical protein
MTMSIEFLLKTSNPQISIVLYQKPPMYESIPWYTGHFDNTGPILSLGYLLVPIPIEIDEKFLYLSISLPFWAKELGEYGFFAYLTLSNHWPFYAKKRSVFFLTTSI